MFSVRGCMFLSKHLIFKTKSRDPRGKVNIMILQSIHGKPRTEEYFQLNLRQFHASNPSNLPLFRRKQPEQLLPLLPQG